MPEDTQTDAQTLPSTVTIDVDGEAYVVPANMLLIDAITDYVGFDMPRFCHHSRLEPVGMCRMCMAEVENRGRWANVATCTLRVADGMKVRVHSPAAVQARRMTLELLLINHPLDCPICDKGGQCMLQDHTYEHGPEVGRTLEARRKFLKPVPISSTVYLDRERCIHCARCTRFVDEIAGEVTIELINRGYYTEISPAFDAEYDSHFAGNTCDICPVGALTMQPYRFHARPWELTEKPVITPYDAAGTNLFLSVRENTVQRAMPRENLAVNDVWCSDKDRYGYDFILHDDRLDVPLVRNASTGNLEPASFDDALEAAVEGLAQALNAGQAVAGVGGTVLGCEEQYAFGKFVRTVLGTHNVITSQPLDFADRAGLAPTFERLEQAKTFLVAGDPIAEHPMAWLRIYKAVRKKGAQLLTLNNRSAHVALAGSFDLACDDGREAEVVRLLLGRIYGEKLHNPQAVSARSRGLGDLSSQWPDDTAARAGELGVDPERLTALAQRLAEAEDLVVVAPPMAGRADGNRLRDALWNLALLLNVPGMEHGGWLEHLLNANTRGALDMGLRPDRLPGPTPLDGDGRERFEEAWGELPSEPGRTLDALLAEPAELGALVVFGSDLVADRGNPFQTARNRWLPQADPRLAGAFAEQEAQRAEALDQVGFLIVSELFLTETAKRADVVLPASCFAERASTYTNFEGRVQWAPQALRPVLGVRSDLDLINTLAAGVAARVGRRWRPLTPESALQEIARLVPGYDRAGQRAMLLGGGIVAQHEPAGGKYAFVSLA